jgi:hypothetical protein
MREMAVEGPVDHDLAVVGGDGTVSLVVDALMNGRSRAHADDRDPAQRHRAVICSRPSASPVDGGRGSSLLGRRPTGSTSGGSTAVGQTTLRQCRPDGAGAAAAQTAVHCHGGWGGRFAIPSPSPPGCPGFPWPTSTVEGRRGYRGRALAVILANAQFFAGGWNVAPKAMLVDGELDVQVIDARKWQAPAIVPRIIKGTHLTLPQVHRSSLSSLSVETSVPWPVEVDGDHIGITPFDARVIPGPSNSRSDGFRRSRVDERREWATVAPR